jgi:WD40 repeat protein
VDIPGIAPVWFAALVLNDRGEARVATAGAARAFFGGTQNDISLWDPRSGARLGRLHGHRDLLNGLAPLPGGLLVSAARDGTVRVWDVWAGEEICLLHDGRETPSIAVKEGRIAIAAGNTVTLVDTRDFDRFIAANRPNYLAPLESPAIGGNAMGSPR